MRTIIINISGILCIASFSFFKDPQPENLKKVGKNLYEVRSATALNLADCEKLKAILGKQYGILSFAQTTTVHYTPVKDMKGRGLAIAEQKLSAATFQQTMLEDGDVEVKQACIYEDCKGSQIGDIMQILSNYNIH